LQNFNVTVIHPNPDALLVAAKALGINETNLEKLVQNKKLEEFILKEMTEHGKKEGLLGFELAKKLRIWPVSFGTLGIFTSTMKLQRHTAKQAFQKQITEMYK
jgi:long-chain acyl-CoA synthetase